MAVYRTTDIDLTSIADAIREKSGYRRTLRYPDGFIAGVKSIPDPGVGLYYEAGGGLVDPAFYPHKDVVTIFTPVQTYESSAEEGTS